MYKYAKTKRTGAKWVREMNSFGKMGCGWWRQLEYMKWGCP